MLGQRWEPLGTAWLVGSRPPTSGRASGPECGVTGESADPRGAWPARSLFRVIFGGCFNVSSAVSVVRDRLQVLTSGCSGFGEAWLKRDGKFSEVLKNRHQTFSACAVHWPLSDAQATAEGSALSVFLLLSRGTQQKRRNETFFRRSDAFFQSFPAVSRCPDRRHVSTWAVGKFGDDDDDEHVWTTDGVSLQTHRGSLGTSTVTVRTTATATDGTDRQPASKTVPPPIPPSAGSYRATGQGLSGKVKENHVSMELTSPWLRFHHSTRENTATRPHA